MEKTARTARFRALLNWPVSRLSAVVLWHRRSAWLIVTAQNTCKDLFKGWWRSKRVDSECVAEQTYLTDPLPSDIWDKIAGLEGKYKLPVYLHYYEGYKTEEIARMLKVNHAVPHKEQTEKVS